MADSFDESPLYEDEILFQSAYGGYPKYALYSFLPFLLLIAGGLLVRAIWFKGGIDIRGFRISPSVVAYGICPVILLLCPIVIGSEIYRRLHPQRIVITEDSLFLPKGRFTNDVVRIPWKDLRASMLLGSFAVIDVYDVTLIDSSRKTKTNISSPLFRRFDDFATFAHIIGLVVCEDWSIKGFLPGSVRGNQIAAQRVAKQIRIRHGA